MHVALLLSNVYFERRLTELNEKQEFLVTFNHSVSAVYILHILSMSANKMVSQFHHYIDNIDYEIQIIFLIYLFTALIHEV